VLGLRNSHDKMFPAGIVAGASVFVCDNLSFSGEVKFARKHTRFINRDLPQFVERYIGQLMSKWHLQDKRIGAYKVTEIEDRTAHDLIVRATEHLPHSEVDEFVKDVFGTWIKKLRAAIPAELPLRAEDFPKILNRKSPQNFSLQSNAAPGLSHGKYGEWQRGSYRMGDRAWAGACSRVRCVNLAPGLSRAATVPCCSWATAEAPHPQSAPAWRG